MPKLSLILPVVDEAQIIAGVVADIQKVFTKESIDYEIILVENESADNTLEVIKNLAKKVEAPWTYARGILQDASSELKSAEAPPEAGRRRNKRLKVVCTKRGYGSAVLAGLKAATGTYVGYMPSDGQIPASILGELFKETKTKKFDLVKIKRTNRETFLRFLRSKVFNLLVNLLFTVDTLDVNGSPRIFKRDKLKILDLTYKDSFIDTEFAVKAHLLGWKVKEIPMRNLERVGGKSTVRLGTVFEFLRNLFIFRFGNQLKDWKLSL